VPVIEVHGLSEAKKRALALADNKISDNAGVHDQDTRDLVARHVERVVPEATVVEIRLRARDVDSSRSRSDGEELVVRVQLERRPRDRKEIIVFANGGMPAQSLDHSLVLTVARGRTCVKALREGEFAGTAEIASKWGLSEPYLKRMLRLAFLAPDIVEAIAEGRHPGGLTLERLLSPVPLAWPEQRWDFGFAP
jgi:hypothetical protein